MVLQRPVEPAALYGNYRTMSGKPMRWTPHAKGIVDRDSLRSPE